MKKKWLFTIVLAFVFMACMAVFFACGDGGNNGETNNEHQHVLVPVQGVAATCTEPGVLEHWRCETCEKLYSDEKGKNEIESAVVAALGHTGGKATCEQKAVCARCKTEYGELADHAFGAFEQTKAPTCTEIGERTAVCSVCQETKTEDIPALGHSGEWTVVAEPRCFDDGEKQRICTVCDALEEESIPAYGAHDLQDSTCVGGKQCTRCNYTEGTGRGHAFDDWKITKAATCTENGEKERVCLVCQYKETDLILKTGHSGDWVTDIEPTCTQNGSEYRYCSSCSYYEARTKYRTGHAGEWIVTKEATCTENGERQRTCTKCGNVETSVIPKSHPSYTQWETITDPTCTTDGQQRRYCWECSTAEYMPIPSTGHTMEWTVTQEATCTENGVKVGRCSVCGQEQNEVISKLGHDMQGGSCTEPSQCTRCGQWEYNSHSFGDWFELIGADCTRASWRQRTCSVCGEIEYSRYPYATGHNFEIWEIREEATCTAEGRERSYCTVCGKAKDRVIEMMPHESGDWVVVEEPDCTTEGLKQKTCIVCGHVTEEESIPALGHTMVDATCVEPKLCTVCGYTEGEPLGHTLDENGCTVCGFRYTEDGLEFKLSPDGNSYRVSGTTGKLPEKLLIPDTYNGMPVTGIAESAFIWASSVTEIYLPNTIEIIDSYALNFSNGNLERVYFESGSKLTSIGELAFGGNSFKSITLPNGLKSIGAHAFSNCSALTSITIPNSVTSIGEAAFDFCTSLQNITVSDGNTTYASRDGILYNKAMTEIIQVPTGIKGSITISDGVTHIPDYAFNWCLSLTGVTLPDSVATIGDGAFSDCRALTSISIPDSVKSIGEGAFYNCDAQLFQEENGVRYVGKWAVGYNGVATDIVLRQGAVGIADAAFNNCSMTSVTIPGSVTSIGESAFSYCVNLTSVYIPDSVTSIGDGAFKGCKSLTSITIPDSVTTISAHMFDNCENLASVIIPDTVTGIGDYAFEDCSSLANITIPGSVNNIGSYAFYNCSGLTTVTIHNGVTTIENCAFLNCNALVCVMLPDSLTAIDNSAFYDCDSIEKVYYGGTEEQWWALENDGNIYYYDLYFYSETYPFENSFDEGQYWHYADDGVTPVIWTKETI